MKKNINGVLFLMALSILSLISCGGNTAVSSGEIVRTREMFFFRLLSGNEKYAVVINEKHDDFGLTTVSGNMCSLARKDGKIILRARFLSRSNEVDINGKIYDAKKFNVFIFDPTSLDVKGALSQDLSEGSIAKEIEKMK